MKILLVEDSLGMRKIVRSMLGNLGHHEVLEAGHGGEAWDLLRRHSADVVLTDWNMPVMSGLELITKIRQSPQFDNVPVVMFTVRSTREDVVQALKAGADTYLTKPFTPRQLQDKLASVLGRRSQGQVGWVLKGVDPLRRDDTYPLVVFGEEASAADQLAQPDLREVVRYLFAAVTSIEQARGRLEEGQRLGYCLSSNTATLARWLRAYRQRVRLVLLSTRMSGNGLTLARLVSINRQGDFAVFLVCDAAAEVPLRARYALERLGVVMLERPRLDADSLAQLLDDYLVPRLGVAPPRELLSPAEIRERLATDIRHMAALPVLPQVHQQIVALDRDPNSDISAWIRAIEVDPLSRAQVIRRARSPIYGFRGEISDADKAVILLGKSATKELIVSSALRRSVEGVTEKDFNVDDYWVHGVAVATLARLLHFPLDESVWTPDQRKDFVAFGLDREALDELRRLQLWQRWLLSPQQDPFLAGMMHDIGKVALVEGYPGLYGVILEAMASSHWSSPMAAAEEVMAGGANHAEVGRILADSWKLGEDVARVVESHHAPGAEDAFAALIALADLIGNGIYPFPRQATYPMLRLLQTEPDLAGAGEVGASAAEDDPLEPQDDPWRAVTRFVPPGLLARLGLELADVIRLGRCLGPTVRRLTEDLRRSL